MIHYQILNKLLIASKESPATVTQFGPAMTIPGQAISMIKGTEEETAATIAILAKATQSIEVGATQTRALATVIAKKGLGGKGLFGGIAEIEKTKFKDDAAMIKFFGRKEAVAGYMGFLKNKEAIFELEKKIIKSHEETGTEADFTRRMLKMPKAVPSIAAAQRARISGHKLQTSQEK